MKNIVLVIGGAGFVGSHLCEELFKSGNYDVYSLDNYFNGLKSNHIPGVNYIEGNSKNIYDLINFIPSLVFHLGEYSRVEQSFDDFDDVWDFNVLGTKKVVEFCSERNAKLVYAGSSTKFGDKDGGRDASPYAWSKSKNTEFIMNYSDWFKLKYAIVYFYNVYGGRERQTGKYATVIGIFKNLYKTKQPITIVKPGNQQRNFTHINDIVRGLILTGEKGYGDGYGIGSNESFSVLEAAQMFKDNIVFLEERRGNRKTAELITDKTIGLGWKAEYKLKDHIVDFKERNKV